MPILITQMIDAQASRLKTLSAESLVQLAEARLCKEHIRGGELIIKLYAGTLTAEEEAEHEKLHARSLKRLQNKIATRAVITPGKSS